MKKLSILLFTLLLVFSTVFVSHAEERTVVTPHVSEEELAILYDTSLYDKELTALLESLDTALTDKPIVKIYTDLPDWYRLARYPVSSLLPLAERLSSFYPREFSTEEQTAKEYYSFQELVDKYPNTEQKRTRYPEYLVGDMRIQITVDPANGYAPRVRYAYERDMSLDSAFFRDVTSADAVMSLGGAERTVLEMYCFEETKLSPSAYVYFVTDGGVFVKCYDIASPAAEPTVFTEEEFREYSLRYDYHCGVMTEDPPSFLHYVRSIYGTESDLSIQKDGSMLPYVAVGAAALLVLGACAFIIVKRRKMKQS